MWFSLSNILVGLLLWGGESCYDSILIFFVLRLALVGTSVDSKASRWIDEVISEGSDTKGYAA